MSLEDLSVEQLRELAGKAQEYQPAHNLMSQLAKDPEARSMFQRYLKKKNPNLSIPEVDTEDRMMAALAAETKKREELEARITAEKAEQNVLAQRREVAEKYHLSEEDMKALEKRMLRSDDNPDPLPPRYDWAAQLFVNSRTPSTPTPASYLPPGPFEMPESKVWGPGIGNPARLNQIAMKEASAAFADIMGGKVAG